MSALSLVGLVVAVVVVMTLLSGALFRMFTSLLLCAGIITLVAWITILLAGFALFIGVPIYCGVNNLDTATVFQHIFLVGAGR